MEVKNKKWSDREFFRERTEVLGMWPTGKGVNLNEAIEYHRSLPQSKVYASKLAEAKQNAEILITGAMGGDTLERHIELLQYCQNEGQADLLSTWVDSFTRGCRFEAAEHGLKEAQRTGKQVLNGFPFVAHGVAGTRKVIESVDLPVMIYGPQHDMRLCHEIGLAGGFTGFNGGPLLSFWQYSRDIPLTTCIHNWQYIYRLVGYYQGKGAPIQFRPDGISPCITPPSLVCAAQLIDALIAVEQGVKNIMLQCYGQGNLIQDVANAIALLKLAEEYLSRFGYKDVAITKGCMHPYGRFPTDPAQAFAILCLSPILARLGGCQLAGILTIDEARTIPRKENNAASLRCARMMLNLLKDQNIDIRSNKAVMIEAELIEQETKAILDRVIDLGDGELAIGAVRAVEAGVLDNPYATTRYAACRAVGVRDAGGAVRYLDRGSVPISNDIMEFHRQKIAERSKKQGREVDYNTIVGDFTALSRGCLVSDPRWQAQLASDASLSGLN